MSNEMQPQDPNLIRVQATNPAPPQTMAPGPQGMQLKGMNIDGMQFERAGADMNFGKPAINNYEKQWEDADQAIMRMESINKSYDPKFLEADNRLNIFFNQMKEKSGSVGRALGFSVTPEDRKEMQRYAVFRRQSAENTNLYIKAITGAQMSEAEADRIRLATPDAGQGIFDGQSPTTYKSNLDDALKAAQLSKARILYMRRNGQIGANFPGFKTKDNPNGIVPSIDIIGGKDTPSQMERIIDQRANQLLQEAKLKDPNGDHNPFIRRALREEFGI